MELLGSQPVKRAKLESVYVSQLTSICNEQHLRKKPVYIMFFLNSDIAIY